LSREDVKNGKNDVSMSIANQRGMLESYAREHGWGVYRAYVDDDVTGTTFDRPAFQEMMEDAERGLINLVLTKDLSRLGRNYIESGRHRELFSEYGVRYIAVLDNHDSASSDAYDISTPIKEVINELYAADISRKVRSSKRLLAKQGKFINSRAPYGYKKSPEDKHVLVVDESAARNVERVYELYMGGTTGRAIADLFNREGILPPNEHFYAAMGKPNPFRSNKSLWGSSSVMQILRNPAYYGAMSSGKCEVASFKNKKLVEKPFEEWVIVEGTHEPIVGKETWLAVQEKLASNRRETLRRNQTSEVSLLAGIFKCADCGGNMAFNRREKKSGDRDYYRCGTYCNKGKNACGPHKIPCDAVHEAVLEGIREYARLAAEDEEALVAKILKESGEARAKNASRIERTARKARNRIAEADKLLLSLYKDKADGEITAEQFRRLADGIGEDREKLVAELGLAEKELSRLEAAGREMLGWAAQAKECLHVKELTRHVAVEMVERVEVAETCGEDGEKRLSLTIFYKFGATENGS
jgi:DNA invertase Pin-like site-specific DNA recombinase